MCVGVSCVRVFAGKSLEEECEDVVVVVVVSIVGGGKEDVEVESVFCTCTGLETRAGVGLVLRGT